MNERYKICPICHGDRELTGYDYDTDRAVTESCFACHGMGFIDLYKKAFEPKMSIDDAIKKVEETIRKEMTTK